MMELRSDRSVGNIKEKPLGTSFTKNYRSDISIMRIVATLAVVFWHTCNTMTNNLDQFPLTDGQYKFYMSGLYLVRWAVPIFLMITGALLLGRTIPYRKIFTKYLKRMLLALLLFGTAFAWLEILASERRVTPSLIGLGFLRVLEGQSWSHLWYIYSLIGVYLILPLLCLAAQQMDRIEQKILLFILFVFSFVIPTFEGLVGIKIGFEIPIASSSVFYVLLGKYLDDDMSEVLKNKKTSVLFILILATLIIIGTCINPHVMESLSILTSPILTILVFSLLKGTECAWRKLGGGRQNVLLCISRPSSIHEWVLQVLGNLSCKVWNVSVDDIC